MFGKRKKKDEAIELETELQQTGEPALPEDAPVEEVPAEMAVVEEVEVSYGDSIVPIAAPKKKRKKGRIVLAVIAILLVGWIVISNVIVALRGPLPTVVDLYDVGLGDVEQTLASTGTITAAEKVTLFSPVAAPITEVNAELGSIVNAGSLLFAYDTVELKRGYEIASAASQSTYLANQAAIHASNRAAQEMNDAQASVDNLEIQKQNAQNNLNNAQSLVNNTTNAINQITWELRDLESKLGEMDEEANPIDYGDLRDKIAELYAKLDSPDGLNAQLAKYTQDLAFAQADVEYQSGLLSQMKTAVTTAEAGVMTDIDRAQQGTATVSPVISKQQALELWETGEAGVQAAITGVVTSLAVEPGAYASQYGALCVIESIDRVNVIVSLSRYDLENVQVGQQATVTTHGQVYDARVSKIDSMAVSSVNSSGTSTTAVSATLEILNPDNNLVLGLDANVSITTGTAADAVVVPVSAINTDVSGSYCYVVEDGLAVRREITMGITGGSSIQILDGLQQGDVVILSSQNILEGQAITAGAA